MPTGIIPTSRPPAYAQQFANTMQGFDRGAADRLSAMLGANATSLGHILDNVTDIAEVGGSRTLDPLISMFAGGQSPVFTNEYAGMQDRLRQQLMEAEIGATQRQHTNTGGGRRGGGINVSVNLANQRTDDRQYIQDYDPETGEPIGTPYGIPFDDTPMHLRRGPQDGVRREVVNPSLVREPTNTTNNPATPIMRGTPMQVDVGPGGNIENSGPIEPRALPPTTSNDTSPATEWEQRTGDSSDVNNTGQTEIEPQADGTIRYRLPGQKVWQTVQQ